MRISIYYGSAVGDWQIYEAFLPVTTKIGRLRQMVSEETSLKLRGILIVTRTETVQPTISTDLPPGAPSYPALEGTLQTSEPLLDARTLESYNLGQQARLWLVYNFDF